MSNMFSIYMAQLNPTVGAVRENCEAIAAVYARGLASGADLVMTAELSVTGYPIEDLVLKPYFIRVVSQALEGLAEITAEPNSPGLLVGAPWREGEHLFNATFLLTDGHIKEIRYKHDLPNYGVFDEKRVFDQGPLPKPMVFRGVSLGVMVCEDMWFPASAAALAKAGADMLIVPTCSPFQVGKDIEREHEGRLRAVENKLPLLFCNQISGQDELVFDGASYVLDQDGNKLVQMAAWREGELLTQWHHDGTRYICNTRSAVKLEDGLEAIYHAMVLGLRDYVNKNRFPGVLLGLSGGVDSALSAAVAVDALGADRVDCVMMPSRFTSDESLKDAALCAQLLGVRYETISIKSGIDVFDAMMKAAFADTQPDTTEENIQSRLRGMVLMALSNKFGKMVLTTGNKSEMSVGYATLYGDMCGGYNVLKDVYKLDVFALCRWRNENKPLNCLGPEGPVMPLNIIEKPPTAELRDNQKDEDSLPPYERLDDILRCLVDEEMSVNAIVARGHDVSEVARIEHLLYIAEYKRRQSPPGVKITRKNYGRDRRYPITNGFRSART